MPPEIEGDRHDENLILAAAALLAGSAMPAQAQLLGDVGGTVGGVVNGTLGGASQRLARRRAQLGLGNVGGTIGGVGSITNA